MGKFSLKGKTALITGGGSGIGKAIATVFAEQGASVHILENDINAAEVAIKQIKEVGYTATAHIVDVSKHDQTLSLVKSIGTQGSIDLLVNNAGIAHVGTVESTEVDDLDRLYNVNIKGVFNCTKACISFMKKV